MTADIKDWYRYGGMGMAMAAYTRSAAEVVREQKSSGEGGLSAKEAAKRLNQYGDRKSVV